MNLGDPQLTAQLAQLYPNQGVIQGLVQVVKSSNNDSNKIARDTLNRISTLGIDLSEFSGSVNWQVVRNSGVAFAFIKATEGLTISDGSFSTNWLQTKRVGIIHGAFHLFQPASDPVKQANGT